MGPQGPHLLPLLFHDGLVLEVGQLGQPGGFLGLGPACAHLFLQFLVAEAGLLKAIGPRSKILYTIKSSIIEMSRNDLRLHRFCTNRNLHPLDSSQNHW